MHEVRDSYIQKTIFVSKQLFVVWKCFEIVESVDDPELPFATFTEPPKELADV
jgi:hypothetical protein